MAAVTLIAGLPCGGKSRLIGHILSHTVSGPPVAVVVKDVADIPVDPRRIKGKSVDGQLQLDSGSVVVGLAPGVAYPKLLLSFRATVNVVALLWKSQAL